MPRVSVTGIPDFVDARRLLGAGDWTWRAPTWTAELSREDAADLSARLRGIVLGGSPIEVRVEPRLKRALVRKARSEDARRRRDTSPGFTRPGVRLDEEGRWSLTPEALALELGKKAQGRRVIDAACGCGGNAIGFARAGCEVVAIELDPERLAMAEHNAAVYGVSDRIRFVQGFAEDVLPTLEADLTFIDPPWSHLEILWRILPEAKGEVWMKVPASFEPLEIPGATAEAWFGVAPGDRQRVKFLLLQVTRRA